MAGTLRTIIDSFHAFIKRYEDVIVKDPTMATKIESMLKVLSYIIPGRFGGGLELSEFAYCVSNLFTLLNDYIITRRCPSSSSINKLPLVHRQLLWSLAVLESIEVVVEVFGESLFREAGKWMIVLAMRLVKAIVQYITVFRYRSRILTSPAVPSVDRKKVHAVPRDITLPPDDQPLAYQGTRTGKIIRSVHADPGIPYSELPFFIRDNGRQVNDTYDRGTATRRDTSRVPLSNKQLLAEGLYISRPLVHIISMVIFQQSSWKPWLLSLAMDVVSLHLHGGLVKFKTSEPSEILRRRLVLLLYLLRSPFYDKFSKNILVAFLQYMASHVPLATWIIDPILEYLPLWQQIYSYNWMT